MENKLSGNIVYDHGLFGQLNKSETEEMLADLVLVHVFPERDLEHTRISSSNTIDAILLLLDLAVTTPELKSKLKSGLDLMLMAQYESQDDSDEF